MKDLIFAILKELAGGAPAEFQVLPDGRIEVAGEEPVYCNETAAAEIIAAFRARGNDMVIDYEHQTLADGESPAAGWIKNLVWKGGDGLWAVVEWTKKAKEYLESREYRYFSPVMYLDKQTRMVKVLINVALTNTPAINNLKPLVAKWQQASKTTINRGEKEGNMIEKLKKLLDLAADAAEDKIIEAATLSVNKAKYLETQVAGLVACKEVLDALGAKEGTGKEEVVRLVASLRAPGDVAVQLSHEVAALKQKLSAMEQTDLVQLALKEGKTSPDELDKWGWDLAMKNPEQFRLIVLSRPVGSVIPVEKIPQKHDQGGAGVPNDDVPHMRGDEPKDSILQIYLRKTQNDAIDAVLDMFKTIVEETYGVGESAKNS
jgi:phage I-like protein